VADAAPPRRTPQRRLIHVVLLVIVLVAAIGAYLASRPSRAIALRPEGHPQVAWAPCNLNAHDSRQSTFTPLSDSSAAALVTRQRETRPYNDRPYTIAGTLYPAPNDYVPTAAQLRKFRDSRTSAGQLVTTLNPYFRYVDGLDGMHDPSTDDLIQWAAHKWGIPEDWLRAEYVQESYWNAYQLGDLAAVSAADYKLYPPQSRVSGQLDVYQSLGITQLKWRSDGSVGAGTEPLRWESTAFNIDYQAAMVRFYYDNPSGARTAWGDGTYKPCQAWNSIGGWYEPYPWRNAGQAQYVSAVQQQLSSRAWTLASFVDWTPSSFPPGIRFK
jgi:hypothetical protein